MQTLSVPLSCADIGTDDVNVDDVGDKEVNHDEESVQEAGYSIIGYVQRMGEVIEAEGDSLLCYVRVLAYGKAIWRRQLRVLFRCGRWTTAIGTATDGPPQLHVSTFASAATHNRLILVSL